MYKFTFSDKNKDFYLKAFNKYYPKTNVKITIDNKFDEKSGTKYRLMCDINNKSSIYTLPLHKPIVKLSTSKFDKIVEKAINIRLQYHCYDVRIQHYHDVKNFQQLVNNCLSINDKSVTRMYVSKDKIFVVLNDKRTLIIDESKIYDDELPIFHLDRGFLSGDKNVRKEFNSFFKIWSENFKNTNAQSWNDPIFF